MRLRRGHLRLSDSLEEGPGRQYEEYAPKDFGNRRHISAPALEIRELREILSAALKSLPGKCRVVMMLCDIAHLNIRETADVLGLAEDDAKTRLCSARHQAREALALGLGRSDKSETGRCVM
jgi:DNA-directed RNA polymerase specialized sigma24 family protein